MLIERPLFIVSAPCAGTGPIFELLSRARHVCTLNNASRNELRTRLESGSITAEEIRRLVRGGLRGPGRWLSAIVANARQIPLLNEAYPDALFIYVHRNAGEQLARMSLDGHLESEWTETTSRIMNDLAALPSRRWCAVDIDGFLSDRPREAALLGRFADLSWRVRPGPAQKVRRRASSVKAPELASEAALFAQANHASLHDLPEKSFWRALPENVAKAVVSSRLAASLVTGALTLPAVAHANTFTVTSAADDVADAGSGTTLRDAINQANANPGPDTITFDPSLNGQTITLGAALPEITDAVTIQGPGSGQLTIDGAATVSDGGISGGNQIFYLYAFTTPDGGSATPDNVTISGLTLQHSAFRAISSNRTNTTVEDVIARENWAVDNGGMSFWNHSAVSIDNCVISGNQASDHQGGIELYGESSVVINHTTIMGNTAEAGAGGVNIDNCSNVLIENSTISGNTTGGVGGGLRLYNGTTNAVIENSTISGNSAVGAGGGVFSYTVYSVLLADTTISGNTAGGAGGGVWGGLGTVGITNSIVAGNTGDTDGGIGPNDLATGASGDVGANWSLLQNPGTAIFQNPDGGSFGDAGQVLGEGNIIGEDPQLSALGNFGGPTETMIPETSSPAVNAGDPNFPGDWPAALIDAGINAPTTDQRGYARVYGGTIDMGAVEVQPPADAGATSTDAGSSPVTDAGSTVPTSDAGTKTTTATGKGCNCNGTSDAALALLTPLGLLLMRRRRRLI